MKQKLHLMPILAASMLMANFWSTEANGQCQTPHPIPVYYQDFGTGARPVTSPLTTSQVPNLDYQGTGNMNPEKIYTVAPTTDLHSNPNTWHHVPDFSGNGRMMVVNDREPSGVTYQDRVASGVLGQGNVYYLSAEVMNILKPGYCTGGGNDPDIYISLDVEYKAAGTWTSLASSPVFHYGSTAAPQWNNIGLAFTTPASPYDSIRISVNNESIILCGNDYAIDDIKITACVNNILLPVKLLQFNGSYKNGVATLTWETENEVNFSHYELERKGASASGSYSIVSSKTAQGNTGRSTYQHSDNLNSVDEQTVYYRLKLVDIDGRYTYSNIILIQKNQEAFGGITISPNPVRSSDFTTLRIRSNGSSLATITIVDMTGKVVAQQQNRVSDGINSIALSNVDRLQPGTYIVRVQSEGGSQTTKLSVIR